MKLLFEKSMSRYLNQIHKSDLLSRNEKVPWLSPELVNEKPILRGILNRIHHTAKLINFILTERDKQVNNYREKMSRNEKLDETFWYLILFTESYFIYVKNMLNAYAELIYEISESCPENTNGNFSKLWYFIRNNNSPSKEIHDYFQKHMRWYEVLIQEPRNKLVIHDKTTSGYGVSDHGIDVYIGKNADHDTNRDKKAIASLQEIITNHQDLKEIRLDGDYFHPVYRQIVEKIDVLEKSEIDLLIDAAQIAGFDFPYIPQINPKLQNFLNFVEGWLENKYQMCPDCKQPNLQITRFVRDPNIRKAVPENIWFGWKCTSCSYMREFNLQLNSEQNTNSS